jgi:hypothetical protein
MKKKILIVSQAFFPENSPRSFRSTELAKEFAKMGHFVTVITPYNNSLHAAFAKEHNIEIKDMGKFSWKSMTIKGKGIEHLVRRAITRSVNLLFEYPGIQLVSLVKKAIERENGYDLLISVAVPHPVHWGVAAARNNTNQIAKVWVADCGDPYMGDKADSFRKPFYFKYIEKWFCRKTNFITVPTTGSIDGYYPEFEKKIRVIPQGFDFEAIPVFTGPIKNDVITFGYAGGFIPGIRDPRPLLDFLCKSEHLFKFIIYTSNADLVLPYVAASNNRIELRSYIPRERLLYELSKMDFLININNGTNVQTPSKLIDYALTKRPILSIQTGLSDKVIIEEFLMGNYCNQFQLDNIDEYNIKNVARKFIDLSEKPSKELHSFTKVPL